jgi:hypothetical protein
MNMQDKHLTIINNNLDDKINDMIQKLERKLKETQNNHIQLPFDIIMNILKMRPRDSQMKSPTAALIKKELRGVFYFHCNRNAIINRYYELEDDDRHNTTCDEDYRYNTVEEFREAFVKTYFSCYEDHGIHMNSLIHFNDFDEDSENDSETESEDE